MTHNVRVNSVHPGTVNTPLTDPGDDNGGVDRDATLTELGRRHDEEPRIDRTLAALTGALFAELRENGLDRVSVAALCRRADLHRTTFYSHYADVPSLAADVFARVIDRYSNLDEHLPGGAGDDAAAVSRAYYRITVDLMTHLIDERPTYRALLRSPAGDRFRIHLFGLMCDRAAIAVRVYRPGGVDQPTAAAAIGGAVFGVLLHLVESDTVDVAAAADGFFALMPAWVPRP